MTGTMRSPLVAGTGFTLGLLLAGVTPAQTRSSVAVPPGLDAAEGNDSVLWAGQAIASRRQLLIDPRYLGGRAGEDLTSLAVRRDGADTRASRGGRVWISVAMSNTAARADSPSGTFAANRGADHTEVYAGYVAFPSVVAPNIPAPWQPPFEVTISLAKPFRYTGGTLCLETLTLRKAPSDVVEPAGPWFTMDAEVRPATGRVITFGASCMPLTPPDPASAIEPGTSLGSTASFHLTAWRSSVPVLFTLGTVKIDVDLGGLGAAGCHVYSHWLLTLPSVIAPIPGTPEGVARMDMPLPVAPQLAGLSVFVQWMAFDPAANRLGLSFSNAVELVVGAHHDLGVAWIESFDVQSGGGQVFTDRTPILRLGFEKQ